MTREELLCKIGLPVGVRRALEGVALTAEEAVQWNALFTQDETAFYQRLRSAQAPELLALEVYAHLAMEAQREYQRLGIEERVFVDSFRDLALWNGQCERQKGFSGLIEWEWNAHALKLGVFRLGRLQYQPRVLSEPLSMGKESIPVGSEVLELHIPEGEPLLPREITASLSAARPFFEQYFGKRYSVCHCHSWLLAPELGRILSPGSNILAFQSRFVRYCVDYDFRQAEERVFGEIREDISGYPEKTSLQRQLKLYLLSGGKIGMGAGLLLL